MLPAKVNLPVPFLVIVPGPLILRTNVLSAFWVIIKVALPISISGPEDAAVKIPIVCVTAPLKYKSPPEPVNVKL